MCVPNLQKSYRNTFKAVYEAANDPLYTLHAACVLKIREKSINRRYLSSKHTRADNEAAAFASKFLTGTKERRN